METPSKMTSFVEQLDTTQLAYEHYRDHAFSHIKDWESYPAYMEDLEPKQFLSLAKYITTHVHGLAQSECYFPESYGDIHHKRRTTVRSLHMQEAKQNEVHITHILNTPLVVCMVEDFARTSSGGKPINKIKGFYTLPDKEAQFFALMIEVNHFMHKKADELEV